MALSDLHLLLRGRLGIVGAIVVILGWNAGGSPPGLTSRDLATQGIEPVVNVIGFQVGDANTRQLRRMASAGGGAFTDARSQAELKEYWRSDVRAMMAAWSTWQREALDTIARLGRENMARASESGQEVMDLSGREWDRAQALTRRQSEDDSVDYDVARGTWSHLYERNKAIWRWGYHHKRQVVCQSSMSSTCRAPSSASARTT